MRLLALQALVPALVLALGAALLPALAAAEPPNAQEIADRAERAAYYQGDDMRGRVDMTIEDPQGRERERVMTLLRRDAREGGEETGDQRFYVYFHAPPDVEDTVFLVWKHPRSDDDRWLYLPALDLMRRIAAEDERGSFVGSDFFYEDVSGRTSGEDRHTLRETTELYYVLRSEPKEPERVEFHHYVSYVHKETFLPVQVDYYKADGSRYRQYSVEEVETVEGYRTITRSVMKDLTDGSRTTLRYGQVEYDLGLGEEIFSERYLRSPPRAKLTEGE